MRDGEGKEGGVGRWDGAWEKLRSAVPSRTRCSSGQQKSRPGLSWVRLWWSVGWKDGGGVEGCAGVEFCRVSDTFGQVLHDPRFHQLLQELFLLGNVVSPRLQEENKENREG